MPVIRHDETLILNVRDLGCLRGGRAVFGDLTLTCAAGGALRLVGPNGAGKSTLLRILAGLLPASAGEVAWSSRGKPLSAAPPLAYCGHRDPVKAWSTVAEHLAFWRTLGGDGSAGPIADAAGAMGLDALLNVPAGLLSAGQKRRLALARLLVTPASLWLLDEPTVSLDREGCGLLEAIIDRHRQSGGLVIVATHVPVNLPDAVDVDMADYDTALVMARGAGQATGQASGSPAP